MIQRLEDEITNTAGEAPVIDLLGWLTRMTLDVIGEGTIVFSLVYVFHLTQIPYSWLRLRIRDP